MSEVLETIMLLCFGFSWPMNVVKNYRAKSARNMSLQFILLIILGYIAGIAAKLYTHNYTYVLAVYLFNLAIVSINLPIYFKNKSLDLQ